MLAITRVVTAVVLVSAMLRPASAQDTAPKYELGVDLGISSVGIDGVDGRFLTVGTPVDVRVGFVSASAISLETRLALSYSSHDGSSTYQLRPGINVLWRASESTDARRQLGGYFTAGAGARIVGGSGDAELSTRFTPALNVGIGHRAPLGPVAFRTEVFVAHELESGSAQDLDFAPARTTIGVRLGISVWQ